MQQIRPGQGVTPSDTLMKIFQENVPKLNTVQFKANAMLTLNSYFAIRKSFI